MIDEELDLFYDAQEIETEIEYELSIGTTVREFAQKLAKKQLEFNKQIEELEENNKSLEHDLLGLEDRESEESLRETINHLQRVCDERLNTISRRDQEIDEAVSVIDNLTELLSTYRKNPPKPDELSLGEPDSYPYPVMHARYTGKHLCSTCGAQFVDVWHTRKGKSLCSACVQDVLNRIPNY